MVGLRLENYYIKSIFWRSRADAPVEAVGFGISEEEQNEAFETIQELLTYEEDQEEAEEDRREEMRTNVPGPKRMEVALEQRACRAVKRQVLVTEIFPPTQTFKYWSASGRIKVNNTGKFESFITRGMSSKEWKLVKVETFAGGGGPQKIVFYNNTVRQDEGWRSVEKFYGALRTPEKKVIENWFQSNASALDDEDEEYLYGSYGGGVHYPQRAPHTYQPPVGFVRVSGDEIGAQIYLKQMEEIVQGGEGTYLYEGQTLQEYLEIAEASEKKGEAGEEEASSATTEETGAFEENGEDSGVRRSGADPTCVNCGSPSCPGCLNPYGVAGEGDVALGTGFAARRQTPCGDIRVGSPVGGIPAKRTLH